MSRPNDQEILDKYAEIVAVAKNMTFQKNLVDLVNWSIDQALGGMILTDEAIKPDWPHGATHARINYYDDRTGFIWESKPINRPKQSWQPTVGSEVFVLMSNLTILKVKIDRLSFNCTKDMEKLIPTGGIYFRNNGILMHIERENVKPYSAQDEGKTWDEIGGQP